MNRALKIFFFVLLLTQSQRVLAIPPPDFLFSLGAQIAQVFSLIVMFFSAVIATSYRYISTLFRDSKYKYFFWLMIAVMVILISLGGAYLYIYSKNGLL